MKIVIVLHVAFLKDQTEGCKNPLGQVAVATKFCVVASNICGFSVWTLLHVTVLAPRILRWLLDFCKCCAALSSKTNNFCHFTLAAHKLWKCKLG